MINRKSRRYLTGFFCALVVTLASCDTTGSRSPEPTAEQLLTELKSRYDAGALTKDEYDRQHAQIVSRGTGGQSRSVAPTGETIRGILC